MSATRTETPIEIITTVSQRVIAITDRLVGDRGFAPIFVAKCLEHALTLEDIPSAVLYGEAAWVEVLPDQIQWGGRWHQTGASDQDFYFWVETKFGEWIDLVAPAIARGGTPRAKWAPPLLWSRSIPKFFKYKPHGMAEIEFTEPKQAELFALACAELTQLKMDPSTTSQNEPPNEPLLISRISDDGKTPALQILDDSQQSFLNYDRAIGVLGIPEAPPI